jgi:hypothetical protein
MINRCGTVAGMRTDKRTRSILRKSDPAPLCSSQIPHDLTWDRTHVAAVESQVLTVWSYGTGQKRRVHPIYPNNVQCPTENSWNHIDGL